MSIKVMIFIDGQWLFKSLNHLKEAVNEPEYVLDYKKLPRIITRHIKLHSRQNTDVIRINYFGVGPGKNNGNDTQPLNNFYSFLKNDCHYNTEIFDLNIDENRNGASSDKQAEVGLATSMVSNAMLPGVYDLAVLAAEGSIYLPALKKIRQFGKRAMLATFSSAGDKESGWLDSNGSLFDFPVMFINDHLNDLRLVRDKHLRTCESCGRKERTYWDGDNFYCSECLSEKQKGVLRVCVHCEREEYTSWRGENFFCSNCRDRHKNHKGSGYQSFSRKRPSVIQHNE